MSIVIGIDPDSVEQIKKDGHTVVVVGDGVNDRGIRGCEDNPSNPFRRGKNGGVGGQPVDRAIQGR